jgi:hypothetical protein
MIVGMNTKKPRSIPLYVLRELVRRQGFRAFKILAQGIKLASAGRAPFVVYKAASSSLAFALSPPVMIALVGYDAYQLLNPEQKAQLHQAINNLVAKSRVKYTKTRKVGHG